MRRVLYGGGGLARTSAARVRDAGRPRDVAPVEVQEAALLGEKDNGPRRALDQRFSGGSLEGRYAVYDAMKIP